MREIAISVFEFRQEKQKVPRRRGVNFPTEYQSRKYKEIKKIYHRVESHGHKGKTGKKTKKAERREC